MRYFTADLHFGHANIIRYCRRPFADVPAMDLGLVERWNGVVADDDTVVVLGDVAMGTVAETLEPVRSLRGGKLLVPGNHDRCWPGAAHPDRYLGLYESVGLSVVAPFTTTIGREAVSLCHFPFAEGDGAGDPFAAHRPVDAGQWLACGHVHGLWRQRGRSINVGVDAWGGRPVAEDALAELIAAGPADRRALAWA